MPNIRIAATALNQTPMDWAGNRDNILAAIEAARLQRANLVCLPEMCVSGYGCEDAFHGHGLHQTALAVLQEMLPDTKGMVVSFGLPVFFRRALFNCACLTLCPAAWPSYRQNVAIICGDGFLYEPSLVQARAEWKVRDLIDFGGDSYQMGEHGLRSRRVSKSASRFAKMPGHIGRSVGRLVCHCTPFVMYIRKVSRRQGRLPGGCRDTSRHGPGRFTNIFTPQYIYTGSAAHRSLPRDLRRRRADRFLHASMLADEPRLAATFDPGYRDNVTARRSGSTLAPSFGEIVEAVHTKYLRRQSD